MKGMQFLRKMSVVLALLALAVAGCAPAATPTPAPPATPTATPPPVATPTEAPPEEISGTVVMWTFPMTADDSPVYDALDAAFNEEYPNISVTREIWPWEARNEKMTISVLPVGEAPDVVYLNTDILMLLIEQGALEPLEKYLGKARIDDYYSVWTDLVTKDGHFYNAPILANNWTYLYNKDIFAEAGLDPEKPPTTWQEVIDVCEKTTKDTDDDGEIDQWCIFLPAESIHTMVNMFVHMVTQFGGEVLDPYPSGETVTVNNQPAVEALSLWVDLYQAGHMPEAILTGSIMIGSVNATGADLWNMGKLAISSHLGAGALKEIAAAVGDKFEYGVVPPLRKSEDIEPVDFGSIGGYSIFAGSDNKEAAGIWVEFMSRPENLHIFLEHGGFIPPSRTTMEMVEYTDPIWLEFAGYAQYSHESILHPRSTELNMSLLPLLQAALMGEMSPQEALDQGAAEWEDILARP